MKKDFIQDQDYILSLRQGTLFRAFFINLIFGAIALGLTYVPVLLYVAVLLTGISPMVMYFSIISAIALWQMLGVILFLVPGIATWWQRRAMRI